MWPSRDTTLRPLALLPVAPFLTALSMYLTHQDRTAVGVFLLLGLGFLLVGVLAFGFYRVEDQKSRVVGGGAGVVVLILIALVAWGTIRECCSPWDVRIVALDCNRDPEYVVIENSSDEDQTMWKWKLQSDPLQEFDLSTIGQQDGVQTITVFSNSKAPDEDRTLGNYLWSRSPKFRDDDSTDYARLVSDTGAVVHTVYCGQLVPETTTATPTPKPTLTPTREPSPTPPPTHIPTVSPTTTATPSPTPTASPEPTPTPSTPTPAPPTPTPEPPTPTSRTCCKICTTGKACGDTCISRENECHEPPGCACDAY